MKKVAALILIPLALRAVNFDLQGGNLTVTSTNLQITFRGPEIVGIANRITGENYFRSPTPSSSFGLLMTQPPSGSLTVTDWTLNGGATAATMVASDATRTILFTVSVDSATQEIVVATGAQSTQPGVS